MCCDMAITKTIDVDIQIGGVYGMDVFTQAP